MEPRNPIIQLEKPVEKFVPRMAHKLDNKDDNKPKKMRSDKEAVMNKLFEAFQKHQYYNIKDLERITKQPTVSNNDLKRNKKYKQKKP